MTIVKKNDDMQTYLKSAGKKYMKGFYIGKTKRRLHDRKSEHFKALTKSGQASAIADHITSTGHDIKWDHFEILATGRSDVHCKIKQSL